MSNDIAFSQASRNQNVIVRLANVRFSHDGGTTWVLDGINLSVGAGERIGIIGPNGAGKSTLAQLIAGLSAPDSGSVDLLGEAVFEDGRPYADRYRKARHGIGIVFQNPADQLITTITADDTAFGPENLGLDRDSITERTNNALAAVDMQEFADADPTRLSGGQQQRVALAGTLAMNPKLIVLDEPTAMLDAQSRSDVMSTLDRLQAAGTSIVYVTHHMEELHSSERVLLLEQGHIRELSKTDIANRITATTSVSDFSGPSDSSDSSDSSGPLDLPYKQTKATPSGPTNQCANSSDSPMISVSHVSQRYGNNGADTLHDFSMSVARGETVALMGRNGSGKTTLTRLLTALSKPTEGTIAIDGLDLGNLSKQNKRTLRRTVGLVMQQPERQLFAETVLADVAYGPKNQGLNDADAQQAAHEALTLLGIDNLASQSPFSLSGGQQRLAAIAGVIATNPPVLIMDEPGSGLDLQASERIDRLIDTLHKRGTTIVLVTHSLKQAERLDCRIVTLPDRGAATHDGKEPTTPPKPQRSQAQRRAKPSYIESLDPRVKLVTFVVLLFTGFTVATPLQLGFAALVTLGIIVAARIKPLKLLKSLKVWLSVFVVLGLINMFFVHTGTVLLTLGPVQITTGGVYDAILYSCRLALVVIIGDVLLLTTTPTKLTDAFGSLLSPLHRLGVHSQEIALVMSLALRFLPTLADEAHSIIDAQAARGGSIETGTPAKRIHALAAIIVPVFTGALRHSDNLALALDARCYEAGIHRTHWHKMQVTGQDYAFIAFCVVYVAVLLLLGRGAGIIWT